MSVIDEGGTGFNYVDAFKNSLISDIESISNKKKLLKASKECLNGLAQDYERNNNLDSKKKYIEFARKFTLLFPEEQKTIKQVNNVASNVMNYEEKIEQLDIKKIREEIENDYYYCSDEVQLPINEHNLIQYEKMGIKIPENVKVDLNSNRSVKLPEGWKAKKDMIRGDIIHVYVYDDKETLRFFVKEHSFLYSNKPDKVGIQFCDSKSGKKKADELREVFEKIVQEEIQFKKDRIEVIIAMSSKYKPEKPYCGSFLADLGPLKKWGVRGIPDSVEICIGFFATEDLANKALDVVNNDPVYLDKVRMYSKSVTKITQENKSEFKELKFHPGIQEEYFSFTENYLSRLKNCC